MHDLLIRRATIIDGTGACEFAGDAAIAGGRFVAVGPRIEGEAVRTLDADGLALAPGFIDIHCHSDRYHLEHPDGEIKLRQGVTLEVVGNCGASLAPLTAERAREAVDHAVGGPGRFKGARRLAGLRPVRGQSRSRTTGRERHGPRRPRHPAHRRHGLCRATGDPDGARRTWNGCWTRPWPRARPACRAGLYYAPGLFAVDRRGRGTGAGRGAARRLLRHPPAQRGRRAAGIPRRGHSHRPRRRRPGAHVAPQGGRLAQLAPGRSGRGPHRGRARRRAGRDASTCTRIISRAPRCWRSFRPGRSTAGSRPCCRGWPTRRRGPGSSAT